MASSTTMESSRQSDENIDDDNDSKDDTKRKSRNLSEKKRRDQFNMLVNQLGDMINSNTRKMDKSTVLKSTIVFLKNHSELAIQSKVHEIQEDWKPPFLSNEEFTHLILEALDGFIMVFSTSGKIHYASESVASLLGYLPSELANSTIYEITYQDDQSHLYNILLNPTSKYDQEMETNDQVSFTCHIKRGNLNYQDEIIYECVHFVGYFRPEINDMETRITSNNYTLNQLNDTKIVFVGTGRIHTPQLIRDMSLVDSTKSEFISRHSLEWKFLFLDHRAPPIIGYLPFEVLGTSGYDYYHVDDLDNVVNCHKSLIKKGEGTSCHYRFLTKGQQWIWLQTRFYIDYNQWNSKPEFIVCTHKVVDYLDVIRQLKKKNEIKNSIVVNNQQQNIIQINHNDNDIQKKQLIDNNKLINLSPKSVKSTKSIIPNSRSIYYSAGSDTSISISSQSSQQSVSTNHSSQPHSSSKIPCNTLTDNNNILQNQIQQINNDTTCLNYNNNNNNNNTQKFIDETILSITPETNFIIPSIPQGSINLRNSMIVNQQNIVMTDTQNQIQNELQRKHEELQQLIVHQQEELRRVSEQLSIVRYGIVSPLINVNLNYNSNFRQSGNSNESVVVQQDIQDINSVNTSDSTAATTISIPLVPVETFQHTATAAAAIIPVPTSIIASAGIGHQLNSGLSFLSGQQQQPLEMHQLQQNNGTQIHQQSGQMMSFQVCQQPAFLLNSSVDEKH